LEKAKAELKETDQKLEKTEQKLKEANAELEQTEQSGDQKAIDRAEKQLDAVLQEYQRCQDECTSLSQLVVRLRGMLLALYHVLGVPSSRFG
jgi:phage-related tail protein